jgi:hypothetical protein
MTKSIIDFFNENNQTCEMYEKKKQLRDAIYAMFEDIFPSISIPWSACVYLSVF